MDDSIPETPINLQGETPEKLADFIAQQAMDHLLPAANMIEETSFRELIDEIIDNLRVPIHDWGVYELAKSRSPSHYKIGNSPSG